MLKAEQEKLEKEIEDVRSRNAKLEQLVDISSVKAVETARKERDNAVAEAKRKINAAEYRVRLTEQSKKMENRIMQKQIQREVRKGGMWFLLFMAAIGVLVITVFL